MNANYTLREKELKELESAKKQWKESEWRLQFLRTDTGQELQQPTEQEILTWYRKHQE